MNQNDDDIAASGLDSLSSYVDRVVDLINQSEAGSERTIVGIAGPPASGKSTLAAALVDLINRDNAEAPPAALLPMDGYHLDNSILESHGLRSRKGAPQTFDALGFIDGVKRLRSTTDEVLFFPSFDRNLDVAIANVIEITPPTKLVVIEGNYLLLEREPWNQLRQFFDITVFLQPSLEMIRQRLLDRWRVHGFDQASAALKVVENDIPNAELVLRESRGANLTLV